MPNLQCRSLKQNLHLADNRRIDNTDKLYKERPYLNSLNRKFQQFGIFSHDLNIDEQKIPYGKRHSAKLFLTRKPIRFVYKVWTLTSSDRYVFNFDIYAGKSVDPKISEYQEFGFSGSE
ncbi:DDE_Tnp_1_7 domain-containing protein, partial [Nephila pilipes]